MIAGEVRTVKNDRLKEIKAVGGNVVYTKDAVFIIKRVRSTHWGNRMNINSKSADWFEYDALLVVTNLVVMKLTWLGKMVERRMYDRVIKDVKEGKVNGIVDFYSLLGSRINRYHAPLVLVETKLERFYD